MSLVLGVKYPIIRSYCIFLPINTSAQQTWSGFSPTTVPDNNRQSGLSPTTIPEMSTGWVNTSCKLCNAHQCNNPVHHQFMQCSRKRLNKIWFTKEVASLGIVPKKTSKQKQLKTLAIFHFYKMIWAPFHIKLCIENSYLRPTSLRYSVEYEHFSCHRNSVLVTHEKLLTYHFPFDL